MHEAGVNHAPLIFELVGWQRVQREAFVTRPLKRRDRVVQLGDQQVERFSAKLAGIEAVELNRSSTALRVAEFSSEDRRRCKSVPRCPIASAAQ